MTARAATTSRSGTAPTAVAALRDATRTFLGKAALDHVSLTVASRDRIGVLGANRSGKSTLLRLLAGADRPDAGSATVRVDSVGWLPQEPHLDDDDDVGGIVNRAVAPIRTAMTAYQRATEQLANPAEGCEPRLLNEVSELQATIDRLDGWDVDARVAQAMTALDCPPAATPVPVLSGGERRRVALCVLLMTRPDLLVLDEPTNHLDAEAIEWLEEHLSSYPGAVVAASHDRAFLDAFAQRIVELDTGRATLFVGSYRSYLHQRAARLAATGGSKDAARATQLRWELGETDDRPALAPHTGMIAIPTGPKLGDRVIELRELSKAYGHRQLIANVSLTLPKAGVVGVVGPNGAGKSTLLGVLAGTVSPDSGSIDVGATVTVTHVAQDRLTLDPSLRVWQAATQLADVVTVDGRELPARAFLATFGFKGLDQDRPVAALSGGERNRLHLALSLMRPGNVLLLDEPTNDLDMPTVAHLETALSRFPGCVVVATHDRWFLRRTATHILASAGEGRWCWFDGGYDAWRRLTDADHSGRRSRAARRPLVRP
jgi:ATPase subunit of ABC transporter with duplicated ATPase domains